jgi:hypothetical protein
MGAVLVALAIGDSPGCSRGTGSAMTLDSAYTDDGCIERLEELLGARVHRIRSAGGLGRGDHHGQALQAAGRLPGRARPRRAEMEQRDER